MLLYQEYELPPKVEQDYKEEIKGEDEKGLEEVKHEADSTTPIRFIQFELELKDTSYF